jgi:type IV pilus assembly protein PilQ
MNFEIQELRREVDRLAESHLKAQQEEIRKAQQVLAEMQNAKQIEQLRDELTELRRQQAEKRETPAPVAPPAEPMTNAAVEPPLVPAQNRLIEITREADGQHLTVRLRDASLAAAINELAVEAGWNVVTGPELSGVVTAVLRNVTAEQAMSSILKVHGCQLRQSGDQVVIERIPAPAATPADPEPPSPAPPMTQLFRLQYLSPQEALPLVRPLLTPGVGQAACAPARSESPEAARSGQPDLLLVKDRAEAMAEIAQLLAQLDVPPAQVDIEATILQVERTGRAAQGVHRALSDWFRAQRSSDFVCPQCGKIHPANPLGPQCSSPEPAWSEACDGWELAQFSGSGDSLVQTIKQIASSEVIATPRIRVVNRQYAEVGLHDLVGRRDATQIQTGGVTLVNTGAMLAVRPHVLDSGQIRLEIGSGSASATAPRRGVDREVGARVTTDVLVHDGCTVVIAGLHAQQTLQGVEPASWTGRLLKNKAGKSKTVEYELVVLVTPRIVNDAAMSPASGVAESSQEIPLPPVDQ